ncbi:hypothetical protein [Mucilaginibacter sp. AK015]|uniref:hypothetical protein n=1 Tax=Mucilaginibacter sp. AK015 TaxID=2723072 RepID=UPI00161FC94C|nr:hypothetical protein [Mucilaginibacter sp. AK015]MBB5394680.1 hypothetical protein [Mucilaginibacter sp. AK015]
MISNKNKIDEQELLVEEGKLKLQKIQEEIVKVLIAVGVQPNIATVAQVNDKLGNRIRVNVSYDYEEVFHYNF